MASFWCQTSGVLAPHPGSLNALSINGETVALPAGDSEGPLARMKGLLLLQH